MHKLVFIEKDSPEYPKWPSLIRKNQMTDFSIDQVVSTYQGFQGELIRIMPITEIGLEQYPVLVSYHNSLLLHVISHNENMPTFLQKEVLFLGYDIGVCEEEKSIFSSIFHEILFGHIEELTAYKNLLNKHFLFPEKIIAESYVDLHNRLSSQGKDVEDYEEMIIYAIWKENKHYRHHTP